MPPGSSTERNTVTEAVVLMAGCGSRLRGSDQMFLKPLIPLKGRPLISYTIEILAEAGVRTIHAVVGFESARVIAAVRPLVPSGINIHFLENREWQKKNGLSVLAAASYVRPPFLLTMSDHLFDRIIIDHLIAAANYSELNLAIDKKLNSIFDPDDAMKVQTRGDRVIAIGKDLVEYDAIDTGLFISPAALFDYLEQAKENDDCSLAEGVRLMAAAGKVRAVDIGNAWWQDIDTPEMLSEAETRLKVSANS